MIERFFDDLLETVQELFGVLLDVPTIGMEIDLLHEGRFDMASGIDQCRPGGMRALIESERERAFGGWDVQSGGGDLFYTSRV